MQNRDSDTELLADSETRRMATIGSIEPYDPSSGDWEAYQERLEMFLDANAVAEGQRVATLLTVIGGTAYKIVRNLVASASPKDKTYTELMDALSAHFSPKPFVIAERYRFHKRDQLPGESIATYVAELRRFARHCNFGTNLEDCLRDRLVCGLSNTHIDDGVDAETSLSLSLCISISLLRSYTFFSRSPLVSKTLFENACEL